MGQSFDDSGLADPWLADQNRVVLSAAAENLGDSLNLLFSPYCWIKLARSRRGSQVDAQLVEGRSLCFCAATAAALRL